MKVLVFTPCFPYKPRIYPRAMESILALKWSEHLEILTMLNRDGGLFEFPEWLVWAMDDPEGERKLLSIAEQYEWARMKALEGDYDALLTIEADTIVPPDTITGLLECGSDIAYGLYILRCPSRRVMPKWNLFTEATETTGISLSEDVEMAGWAWGQIIPVEGAGFGCTLIKRSVLDAIAIEAGSVGADWELAMKAKRMGFTQKANLSVVCGHQTLTPSPRILWPEPGGLLFSIEFLDDTWGERQENGTTVVVMNTFGTTFIPV